MRPEVTPGAGAGAGWDTHTPFFKMAAFTGPVDFAFVPMTQIGKLSKMGFRLP
jgi:hypothetical protein